MTFSALALVAIADAVRPGLWSPPGSIAAAAPNSAAPVSPARIAAVRAEVERRRAAAPLLSIPHQARPATAPPVSPAIASSPEAWRAEWRTSQALQAEFATVESYVALRQGEASGRVKIIAKAPAVASLASTPEGWRAEWQASPALQAEFADIGDYVALCRAEKAGRVKLWR